ncbi:hypothetical protein GCM10015535_53040 [Streptomyces gelaticus]|uniref:Uncharacterized protein n=1 Tax=Streptomyces gelaticus TaxID=285446 RepID=A0ABQ2W4W3_9ACTN|nr:hypothetical protein GCM10015535_53040 [Streptomyces gelaticus]
MNGMDYRYQRLPAGQARRAPRHPNESARRTAPGRLRQTVAARCRARLTSYTPGTSRMARIRAGSPAASGSCRV